MRTRWELLVRLVHRTFRDGIPLAELAWAKIELISKVKGEYRGIVLVVIVWNICAVVVNCWLKRAVVLHDALHGFRGGRGTGTATLESKLAQQLVGLAHEPLFQMFLDIRKVYDSLDRERCLDIFSGYGVRPNITCLLKSYWER